MYKVLLVDDESIIRKGLKNTINWAEYNCEVCAEARDGYEGLDMIDKHKPDIVFVDIRMPAMDGLEMIAQMNNEENETKVVILTGYSDFAYAREAIALGVYDFLLKPTKLDEIKNTISKIVIELDKSKEKAFEIEELYSKYNQYLPKMQERLLYDIMTGITREMSDINKQRKELKIDLEKYYLAIVSLDRFICDVSIEMIGAINTYIDMIIEYYKARRIIIDERQYAIIIYSDNNTKEEIRNKLLNISESIASTLGVCLNIMVSSEYEGIESLYQSYNECRLWIIREQDSKKRDIVYQEDEAIYDESALLFAGIKKAVLETISNAIDDNTEKTVINLLENTDANEYTLNQLISLAHKIEMMIPECEYEIDTDSHESIKADIGRLAAIAARYSPDKSNEQTKLIVQKTKEHLKENYFRHVTLAELSQEMYVSTYYISRVFSKETGITITDYINHIRINQACELLKNIKLKVYQIGVMVGISDPHYFSRIFKKLIGMTPSEYRNLKEGKSS